MKRIFSTLLPLFVLLSLNLNAQGSSNTSPVIEYIFEEFTEGIVVFKDFTSTKGKLNYNLLAGEMQFIDPSTNMVLSLIGDIRVVSIAGRDFIPRGRREYVEILVNGEPALSVARTVKVSAQEKAGAYGTYSSTTSISTFNSIFADGQKYDLSPDVRRTVKSDSSYWLIKGGKFTFIKNQKAFLNAYPKSKRASIEQFISENKIDFKNENDLINLTIFSNQP